MHGFSVTLQRKRVKNINLRVRSTGEVQLSAPIKTSMSIIYSFLHNKYSWIEMHRHRLQQQEKPAPQNLITGEYVNFQGTRYALQLHEVEVNQRIELIENQLHLFLKPDASQTYIHLFLTTWYRTQMQQCLPFLLNKWQSAMGVTINKVSIKSMKSRWGSCHPIKKHITLNLRLIEKPLICLEYVIVHELVHLFEAGHNKRFYTLMTHYLPDWRDIKKLLT